MPKWLTIMAINIWPETNKMKNVLAPILGIRKVVTIIMKAAITPGKYRYGGIAPTLGIESYSPKKMKINMEVIRATTKKMTVAAIEEPRYLATELFIGKYIATIMPINNATKTNVDVCIGSFLHSFLMVRLILCAPLANGPMYRI